MKEKVPIEDALNATRAAVKKDLFLVVDCFN